MRLRIGCCFRELPFIAAVATTTIRTNEKSGQGSVAANNPSVSPSFSFQRPCRASKEKHHDHAGQASSTSPVWLNCPKSCYPVASLQGYPLFNINQAVTPSLCYTRRFICLPVFFGMIPRAWFKSGRYSCFRASYSRRTMAGPHKASSTTQPLRMSCRECGVNLSHKQECPQPDGHSRI